MNWLHNLFHIHLWDIDQRTASKGNLHLVCRCGATKITPVPVTVKRKGST